ncbi:aspartyl-tRNA(Asn)/glutamyl-tRNA (Gln) amidotransferase subunit B [Sporothrix brasiliensis 5110]|uniref:Glutamyl-tRNA(Gln) amidotransferase subunit B, mitochondrial n=1 Tax=Sporothrix brasiliensis 5110 TaxID=1398154 RepID=A0A0C2IXL7_9PEZI|nr:aspartyl-tRNA(Asn)/glutamyl-tRNA (Gln) amidotransferase subunit B [Sporothrix brasiliensis 5110]KIH93881.1 aspartyl-tRNA(Asn)/glutamyl-tRNA (Gln) amidotransferase subunit B [Sporothrix brasiliensis 5110]
MSPIACLSTRSILVDVDDVNNHNNAADKSPPHEAKARKAKAAQQKGSASGSELSHRGQTVPGWELTVGIEIHAQLNTAHKLFSSAQATSPLSESEPNAPAHVAFFDVALPGAQPIFQPATLIPAIRAALALGCTIQPVSRFDRKHYFHWDQPAGYQLTQYYEPLARDGHVDLYRDRDGIAAEDGDHVRVAIVQVQMEQDTAKTVAQPGGVHWLDYNRVGMPLVEIITAPQLHHPATAAAFVRKVQQLLVAADACTSGLEAGGLRADVNVSVRRVAGGDSERSEDKADTARLGVRTEIKNLNSFRAVEDAIIAERNRQIAAIVAAEAAGHASPRDAIVSETRGWTPPAFAGDEGKTHRLRGKEGEVDYRYMPDPDLGPVVIDEALVQFLQLTLGASPDAEMDDLIDNFGLSPTDAAALMALDGGGRAQYYYDVVEAVEQRLAAAATGAAPGVEVRAFVANWVLHQLGRLTSDRNASFNIGDDAAAAAATATATTTSLDMTPEGRCRIPVACLADILAYRYQGRITAGVAKELLFAVFRGDVTDTDGGPSVTDAIAAERLWFDEISADEYAALAQEAIADEAKTLKQFASPAAQKKYPHGKLQYLVGKLLRLGPEGRTDPQNAEAAVRAAVAKWVEDSQRRSA